MLYIIPHVEKFYNILLTGYNKAAQVSNPVIENAVRLDDRACPVLNGYAF